MQFLKECNIEKLSPYPGNPRKNDDAVQAVANSLEKFGFLNPIICDENFQICAGHTRYKAALQLGLKTVPVIVAPELIGDNFTGYNIADNQTATIAEWDEPQLAQLIQQLNEENNDFDVNVLAFSNAELNEIMAHLDTYGTDFTLPSGEKSPFEQITFTLSADQAEQVRRAMKTSADLGPYGDTGNENGNGNAMARICEVFIGSV